MIVKISEDRFIDTTQISYITREQGTGNKDFKLTIILLGQMHELWFKERGFRDNIYDRIYDAKQDEAITNLASTQALQKILNELSNIAVALENFQSDFKEKRF